MSKNKKYDYNFCQRIMNEIQKSYLEYGKNRIFLCGEELNDLFLRNIREGYYGLEESLKDYILHNSKFKWFITYKTGNKIKYYQKLKIKEKMIFQEATYESFHAPKKDSLSSSIMGMKNREESSTKKENAREEEIDIKNNQIKQVVADMLNQDLRLDGGEICLFIEDLDWVANFYEDGGERDNSLIKHIKDMEKLKNNLLLVSLKDKELLEQIYYEKYDDKELLMISKASALEIELSLYRILWKYLKRDLKTISIQDIALGFSNSKTSLRESIRIFTNKLEEYKENLSMECFEFKEKIKEKVYWDDIIIHPSLKGDLLQKIRDFKKGELKSKGVLLYGPPGTGKTMIAKAMATEEKFYFLSPKLSELKGEYVGQSAPKIKKLFEEARANEPTLIFLDEIDTLFPSRNLGNVDSDSYTKDMTNEFLQQLDGVDTGEQKVFVVGATNREYVVDSAVLSRLGEHIKIDLPKEKEIEVLYNKECYSNFGFNIFDKLDRENSQRLKRKSFGMAGRDIKNISDSLKNEELKNLKDNSVRFNKKFSELMSTAFHLKIQEIERTLVDKGLKVKHNIEKVKLFGADIQKILEAQSSYIKEVKETFNDREKRKKLNIKRMNGILLYGPPGNGKTQLVQNICAENNLIFLGVEGKSFASFSQKEAIDNIDFIFRESLKLSKLCDDDQAVVLFFDEFDSLVGNQMSNLVRGTILTKLSDSEGIRNEENKVLLMAATNFYDQIDEAVKRPGRFDDHFLIRNPRKEEGIKILTALCEEEGLGSIKVKEFYQYICESEVKKEPLVLTDEKFELSLQEKENLKKYIEERNEVAIQSLLGKSFVCSASALRNHVMKLKRFMYEKNYFEDTNEDILEKYKERYL